MGIRDFVRSIFTKENIISIGKTVVSTILSNSELRKIVASYVRDEVHRVIESKGITEEDLKSKIDLASDVTESITVGLKAIQEFQRTGDVPQVLLDTLNSWSEGKKTPVEYK